MRKLCVLLWVFLVAALAGFTGPAAAKFDGKGVALVIGNSHYVHAANLPNPEKDALLVATTLREAGFDVIQGNDLDKKGMSTVIDQFTDKAYDADVALIYYAGHGMEVDGKNYLIPVDAELTAPSHLKTQTIEARQFLDALPSDPAVGIVILDACRDNPLAKTLVASLPASRSLKVELGLAPMQAAESEKSDGGVLIAYSTWPGQIAMDGKGGNSPYSLALSKELTQPGIELQKALMNVRNDVKSETGNRQTPWISGSLGKEVYLGGKVTQITTTAAQGQPDSIQPANGPLTAEAAKPANGAQELRAGDERGGGWAFEQRLWDEASKHNTVAYYEAYLAQFPNGGFAAIARLNIDQLKEQEQKPQVASAEGSGTTSDTSLAVRGPDADAAGDQKAIGAGSEITESAIGLDRDGRIDLQLRLKALNFDVGSVDGSIGSISRKAIAVWQKQNGLPATAFLTATQYGLLKSQTDQLMPAVRAQFETDQAASPNSNTNPAAKTGRPASSKSAHKQGGGKRRQDQQTTSSEVAARTETTGAPLKVGDCSNQFYKSGSCSDAPVGKTRRAVRQNFWPTRTKKTGAKSHAMRVDECSVQMYAPMYCSK